MPELEESLLLVQLQFQLAGRNKIYYPTFRSEQRNKKLSVVEH